MIHWDNHVSGDLECAAAVARGNWYGVGGIPDVRIDGMYQEVGGGDGCNGAANRYRPYIQARLDATSGISPVEIVGSFLVTEQMPVQASFELLDPATLVSLRATVLIYEDDVLDNGTFYQHITRDMYEENVVLTTVGDKVTIGTVFTIDPGWKIEDIKAVAYLQQTSGNRQMIQGAMLELGDFNFEIADATQSVPAGTGEATFEGILSNIGEETDTYTLELSELFGDWTTEYQVCGDPTWYTGPHDVTLGPAGTCDVTIRVLTDGSMEVRSGKMEVTSGASAQSFSANMQLYNGSYAILFVDDDRNHSDDVVIRNALDNLGVLYEHWDMDVDHGGGSPSGNYLSDFDYVIWHHSQWPQPDPLYDTDVEMLMDLMDNGGSLLLTSQIFLDDPLGPPEFITDYLGAAEFVLEQNYEHVTGVSGDDIGDGLDLPLDYTIFTLARGDGMVPGPTAGTSLVAAGEVGAAIHNDMPDAGKSFFMAFPFETISEIDPDPNNATFLMGRILDWLEPETPQDVDDSIIGILGSRIDGVNPNPFNPRTEIAITLSNRAALGDVQLGIFDLEGRKITTLVDGTLPVGPYVATWDGRNDAGSPVQSGVYFAKLTTVEGVFSEKMVLLK